MNVYSKFAWTATPLALVLVCIVLYVFFDANFVRGDCVEGNSASVDGNAANKKVCSAIDATLISNVKNASNHDASRKLLTNLQENSNAISDDRKKRGEEFSQLQGNLANRDAEIDNLNIALAEAVAANIINLNQNVNINGNINQNTDIKRAPTPAKPFVNQTAINANINRLTILKTQVNNQAAAKQTNINALNDDLTKNTNQVTAVRGQYSKRYSNRILWIFLTALFIALSIAAIVVATHVIFKTTRLFIGLKTDADRAKEEKTAKSRFWIWIGAAVIASIGFTLFIVFHNEEFMSVALPMLMESVIPFEGISAETLIFFTVSGFWGAIFLIIASCAIFRAAVQVDEEVPPKNKVSEPKTDPPKPVIYVEATPPTTPPTYVEAPPVYVAVEPQTTPPTFVRQQIPPVFVSVEDTDTKLEIYAVLMKYLRTILYVGTFTLFVGILRINFMMNWHLSFISNEEDNIAYKLIKSFWESATTVQGGFYTILLAAIYLPAAFWIGGKISGLGKDKAEMESQGVSLKFTDVFIRLLAIVSPLIASGFGAGKDWLNIFGGN
ncbi:MAG TPA: hypothetical protein VGC76_15840 [Pyrinomonadaceae bacterium]|jgi:hypothetical protein